MERAFGSSGMRAVVAKTVATNALALPFAEIPAFHICTQGPRVGLREAVLQLRANFREAVLLAWAVWVPTSVAIFWVLPPHLRLPACYVVDTCWACLLSRLGHRENS